MEGFVWLVLPTYNEAENIEPLVEAALAAAREERARRPPDPDRRRRLAGRHRRDRRPPGRRATTPSRCSTGARARVSDPPTSPASARARGRRRAGAARWTRTSPTTRPTCRACSRRSTAGADLALGSRYVPGGGVENWGLLRRVVSRGGCALRALACSACGSATSRAASSASAARCSSRSSWRPCARTATASRSS